MDDEQTLHHKTQNLAVALRKSAASKRFEGVVVGVLCKSQDCSIGTGTAMAAPDEAGLQARGREMERGRACDQLRVASTFCGLTESKHE